jgi:hypothetical protein
LELLECAFVLNRITVGKATPICPGAYASTQRAATRHTRVLSCAGDPVAANQLRTDFRANLRCEEKTSRSETESSSWRACISW